MNRLECGGTLRWNPLRGYFKCKACKRSYYFHAGELQAVYHQTSSSHS